jgi:cytochrome c peroxidase
MRGPFGGTGLLDDADWISGTVNQTLGDPKAGLSDDLDALAAYVESLAAFPRSPHRANDGALTLEAQAGRLLFESPALGCTVCHTGATMTDSGFLAPADPLLHDVGTIGPGSGLRLGEPLTGLDTPTLHELWNSPPYLHDGSAQDLLEVLTAKNLGDLHGATSSLSAAELASLVAYLLSLEGQP